MKRERGKVSALGKGNRCKKESIFNGTRHTAGKSWIRTNGQMESKQQEKEFIDKKTGKDSANPPEAKKKRVSFADDLEKMKVFDKRMKLAVTPSTASPGRSIIMKKEDGMKEICNEVIKKREFMQETSMNSVRKLVVPNSEEEETKKSRKRQLQKISCGKIRPTNERRKLQVTRKIKQKLLNMPKKERKVYIRELRRKHKPHFDLVLQCKHLWEKLRCGKTSETEQKKLVIDIYGIVKGKVKELIFAHDACRIVECMVKNGGSDVRNALFEELVSEIINMTKSKYARFFVIKMLKHGSVVQRQIIFDAFRGHCVSLLRMSSSAQVLESAYNDYANAQQRYNIIIEFYGVDFSYFKAADNRVRTLKEIIMDYPSRKSSVVKYLENILIDIVDKPQIKLSLTHRLLSDFFEFADNKQLEEMIDSLKLYIPQIVHTNDGVRIAMKCLWNSSARTRKVMLKNFKGLVMKTCLEEFAHRFLIAVFDTVDDTVLIDRYLLKELLDNIDEIIKSNYGVKIMHHLIHPRDPRFCSASQIAVYKAGDENPYSKKDSKLRYAELFSYIQKPFCSYFATNMDVLLFESHASLLILDLLEAPTDLDVFDRKVSLEDRAACYDAIALICSREFIPCDREQLHPVEHPQAHFVISKLLKSDSKFDIRLGDFIMERCRDQLSSWLACNKGCFILLHILENASQQTQKLLRSALSLAVVGKYHTKGAAALKQKLK
ncbi:CPL domain family protein [Brugia pahangi]